jgi:hypothetical protein
MSELIREIEEDIRRERYQALWRRFGKAMVIASVLVVLATIVAVVWKDRQRAHAMTQTSQLLAGIERLNAGDYKIAVAEFDKFIADENSPYYAIAMLHKAQAQNGSGDKYAAANTYAQLSAHDGAWAELARLRQADAPAEKTAVFYYSQSELRAWRLLELGKKDEAVTLMIALRDDANAPRSLRERLAQTLAHIAPEKIAEADAPKP